MNWTKHQVWKPPEFIGRDKQGRVQVRLQEDNGVARWLTEQQLIEYYQRFEQRIIDSIEDPLRYGWEPDNWKRASALLDEHRELLILGGNRSGKSTFAAKRMMRDMLNTPNGRFWAFQTTSATSIEMQQPIFWNFMPPELRVVRKSKITNISYGQKTGFAENSFVMPNGAQIWFRNYSQEITTLEGGECDGIWFDELVDLERITTARMRLLTRKGYMLITFTPIEGYTTTVGEYLNGAMTLEDRAAELLPVYREDNGDKIFSHHERVPVLQEPARGRARILYFHTIDNPFGGYDEMVKTVQGQSRAYILERAYGVPTKSLGNMFAKFDEKIHLVDPERVPKTGTNYHVVDPCAGRNWFMIWARFDDTGRCFIYDEWPNQDRYIPGWGFPGPWAEPDGKLLDGRMGSAQKSAGFGLQDYKNEIDAVEREHGAALGLPPGEPIEIFERLMDSRYGNSQTVARESATTLIEECAEIGLHFTAAPGDTIREGADLINNLLAYNRDEPIDFTNQPKLYVSRRCKNLIYALMTHTGVDKLKGATKDPIDVLRYLVLSGARHLNDTDLSFEPRGSY